MVKIAKKTTDTRDTRSNYKVSVIMSVGVEVLVADSGAFIKAAPLERWSGKVYTVKEVVEEIRDVNTRRRLQVLPFELVFREPSQEALRHVTMFAKKTGDYPSLSPVDMKLMALTYQLECELGPEKGTNLKKEPQRTQPGVDQSKACTKTIGFYSETDDNKEYTANTVPSGELSTSESRTLAEERNSLNTEEQTPPMEDLEARLEDVHVTENCSESRRVCTSEEIENVEKISSSAVKEPIVWNGDGLKTEWNGDRTTVECAKDGGMGMEDDSDSEGWITPENFQQACEEMGGVLEEKANGIAVGCTTTDYAMQNVMLQMGLNVLSLDGMRIKQLRMYALHCKACFKTTSNTSQLFCPNCGNRMLIKVSVLLDENGATHYRHLSDKQYSHKGLRYSLPLPKGGRHAHNPLLSPDQRVTQKARRSRMNKVNPLSPDYIAQESPFAMKDVTSRGAKIASMNSGRIKTDGRRKRNPNAVQPKGRRK